MALPVSPPDLWWSPSMFARAGWSDLRSGFVARHGDGLVRAFAVGAPVDELPADAVQLVPATERDVARRRAEREAAALRRVAKERDALRAAALAVTSINDDPLVCSPPPRHAEAIAALRRVVESGAEAVDEKGRCPSYWRGWADGRIAERAGAAEFARSDDPARRTPQPGPHGQTR